MRSYRFNRFFDEGLLIFNTEYRYNVWEYANLGTDAFALFDIGEVFGSVQDFSLDDLKWSCGGGFNFKFRKKTFSSVSLADGNEGLKATITSRISF